MQQKRRSDVGSWLSWLIFLLLIFGSRFLPPVASWLTQTTGLPITTPMLIGALVMLSIAVSLISSVARRGEQPREPLERPPTLPTSLPDLPTASSPFPPPAVEATGKLRDLGPQSVPQPPRFEPIISPRMLIVGIIGLGFIGLFLFLAMLIVGTP